MKRPPHRRRWLRHVAVASVAGTAHLATTHAVDRGAPGSLRGVDGVLGALLAPRASRMVRRAGGRALHGGASLGLAVLYDNMRTRGRVRHDAVSGVALGIGTGAAGVAIWWGMLRVCGPPPGLHPGRFYAAIFLGNLAFGCAATAADAAIEGVAGRVYERFIRAGDGPSRPSRTSRPRAGTSDPGRV